MKRVLNRLRRPNPYWTPPEVSVGEHTYGSPEVIGFSGAHGQVEIGRYCSIADGVKLITSGGHHTEWVTTFPLREMLELPSRYERHPVDRGPIVIGHDVWIGREAMILDGVTVGHGAVIGARAMVVKDVRPYAIVGGNPAREIRRRFSDEQIEALLEVAWWEWPHEKVLAQVNALNGASVDAFLAEHAVTCREPG